MHVILSMHQIITYKPQGDVAIRVIIVRLVLHGCIVHAGLADSQLLEHLQHHRKVMCKPCTSCTCNSVLNYTLVFDVWSGDTT